MRGSHKQLFATPRSLRGMDAANGHSSNGIVVNPEIKAGDALLFTALRHGTLEWKEPRSERRSLLLKYLNTLCLDCRTLRLTVQQVLPALHTWPGRSVPLTTLGGRASRS